METRVGVRQTVEPALTIVLMFVFSIGNTIYIQEHMNRTWDQVTGSQQASPASSFPPPPPPPPS
jgi:hypothetical protein